MWDVLPEGQKDDYRKVMCRFASFTELFAQKSHSGTALTPYISPKLQETMFQKIFGAIAEDINNTSFDASLKVDVGDDERKYLIGIKTFGFDSGYQKIAQFKGNINEWSELIGRIESNAKDPNGKPRDKQTIDRCNHETYKELAFRIADLRNKRIRSSLANIRGFDAEEDDSIIRKYHVLMPAVSDEEPIIYVGELNYDVIDMENITIKGCTGSQRPANFVFEDGRHTYRYTSADSQLLMDFDNRNIVVDSWVVKYLEDAYETFMSMGEGHAGSVPGEYPMSPEGATPASAAPKQPIITESYQWKITNDDGEVERFSGFNNFYGTGSKIPINQRKKRIQSLEDDYKERIESDVLNGTIYGLRKYLLKEYGVGIDEKLRIRDKLTKSVKDTGNEDFISEVMGMLYRPFDEMYIPIKRSREFHAEHPDFFGPNACKMIPNTSKLAKSKEERTFNLVFEPSGASMEAFITQDYGKGIQSIGKQSILGNWIRTGIFQLEEYQPLTAERLNELEINGIRLYKTEGSDDVHLEFIWIDD